MRDVNNPTEALAIKMRERISWSLLLLRISVFSVMFLWTLDKFVNPAHAAKVFDGFYGISGLGASALYAIGALELLVLAAFVTGSWPRLSYGSVLVFHAISTLSSLPQYLDPFNNLLFFTAWPMLAACIALYLLRDLDVLWVTNRGRKGAPRLR